MTMVRRCPHQEPPEKVAARLLSGAGSGAVHLVVNGRDAPPLPVLHGRGPTGQVWVVSDHTRLAGWQAVDDLRPFPVAFGVVEQAPLADLCVTTANLLGRGTARVVPPGQQLTVACDAGGRPQLADVLESWAEARVYQLCLAELSVDGPFGRVAVDPDLARDTPPDPFALDQLDAVERILSAHADLVVALAGPPNAPPWSIRCASAGHERCGAAPGQVRLIAVDQRGATALRVCGTTGVRVRIPFRRPVQTVDDAIEALLELAPA